MDINVGGLGDGGKNREPKALKTHLGVRAILFTCEPISSSDEFRRSQYQSSRSAVASRLLLATWIAAIIKLPA
jgi:hypothetical protein